MLTVEGVAVAQGDFSLEAEFTVGAGQRVAVIGPSGAGKSTVLSLIAGFIAPLRGRLTISGQDVTGVAPGKRPLSILFQDSNLFPHLSVFQNVALGIRPNLKLSEDERERIEQALARVGLDGFADRKPAALSGGQQSRAALARVLLRDTPLLLLDEPFSALGPALKTEMLDLVQEIAEERRTTLLMVTHDPQDARRICGEAILVADGRAHAPVPTAGLLDNPPESLKVYLGA